MFVVDLASNASKLSLGDNHEPLFVTYKSTGETSHIWLRVIKVQSLAFKWAFEKSKSREDLSLFNLCDLHLCSCQYVDFTQFNVGWL